MTDPVEIIAVFIPFVGISIPIIAIIMHFYEKRAKMRVIEKAIEKGVQLDNLSLNDPPRPNLPYRSGMVTLACGFGIIILGIFFGFTDIPEKGASITMNVLLGCGALVGLIGAALLVNDRMNISRYDPDSSSQDSKTRNTYP